MVSGTLERGLIKKGDECEFLGHNRCFKSIITGEKIFPAQCINMHVILIGSNTVCKIWLMYLLWLLHQLYTEIQLSL